jgi:hypothetical protein
MTIEKTDLEKLLESIDTNMLNDPGSAQGTISAGYGSDTITLSSGLYSNTMIGGGYALPNVSISSPYTSVTGITQPWYSTQTSPKIKLDGEGADIEVNGESLIAMIKRVEERLNLLTPNQKLEEEWEELRALGDQYRKLEQHIKDKQATWDRLKAMPKVDID